MRKWLGIGAILALSIPASALAETWDMPMAYPDSNFHSENGKTFAACVGEKSNSELEITVHAGGSLYKGDEIKRAVQTGQVPIGERLLSAHQNENAVFGYDSLPFLATSYEASEQLNLAAKPTLEKVLDAQNLVPLYSVPWGPQGLYTKKDVNSGADMQGVKFRAYNTATARIAELMGAVPVQIEAAELSQALATGVAESFISSGSTGYDSKVWEQLNHWYDVQAWLPRNYVLVNKGAWEGLPQTSRAALVDCADEAEGRGTAKSQELNDFYKAELEKNGMTVAPPSKPLTDDFLKVGETITNEWLEQAGEDGKAILDAYNAAQGG